jgi:hypothetical protein
MATATIEPNLERPIGKTQLPFRFRRDEASNDILAECDIIYPDGQHAPQFFPPFDETSKSACENSLAIAARAAWKLARMFWNLEAGVDATIKERDQLRDELTALRLSSENALKLERQRVEELKNRLERMKK